MFAVMHPQAKKAMGHGVFAVAIALATVTARADEPSEKEKCIAASDQGQQLRDDGKYSAARDAFMRCAEGTCPALVKHDCVQWLVDLDQRAPTVVLSARDDKGGDLVDVKVTLDGKGLASRLDGEPIRVDPGAHILKYEAPGFAPVELQVVIRAGQKNRILGAQFSEPAAEATAQNRGPDSEAPPAPASSEPRSKAVRPPLATWVFGGVAVAAFASELYFGLSGLSQRNNDLQGGGCSPQCSSAEVSSIRTKFVVADVSLGAGIASAGLAAYFFLRPGGAASSVTVGFAPLSAGAAGTIRGRF